MSDTAKVKNMNADSGGSDALKAFRVAMAEDIPHGSQGSATGAAPDRAVGSTAKQGKDARAAERKVVNGRARMAFSGGVMAQGKMVDISKTGASVLLEDMLAVQKTCTLECNVFYNGKSHIFTVPAVSVYCVLVSGKGFKAGFQFGPCSPAASSTIDAIFR